MECAHDITVRRMLEDILAVEEEHADDLLIFLKVLSPTS
jgi:bacterioferritin (cytochrome b1)